MDPSASAIIVAVIAPICAAIGWLYTESRKQRAEHVQCETRVATLTAELAAAKDKISAMEGSIDTLTKLLKREIHLG